MSKRTIAAVLLCATWMFAQSDNSARQKLIASLNAQANVQLAERAQSVAKVLTRADAEKRKDLVRHKILDLIGGLPKHSSSVTAKQFGTLVGVGFRIEKLAYESLPGLWVTANSVRSRDRQRAVSGGVSRAGARGDRQTEPVFLGSKLRAQRDYGAGNRSFGPR